jgi:hypothetical protein
MENTMTVIFERETLPYLCLKHEQPEIRVHLGLFVREDGALSVDVFTQAKKGETNRGVTFGFWMKSPENIDALIRFFERFRDVRNRQRRASVRCLSLKAENFAPVAPMRPRLCSNDSPLGRNANNVAPKAGSLRPKPHFCAQGSICAHEKHAAKPCDSER